LPGTMAAEVRRLLPRWGFRVEERRLEAEDLLSADQVFLTNSLMGAVPALSLHDAELRYDSALCDKINEAVFNRGGADQQQPTSGLRRLDDDLDVARGRGRLGPDAK
jgi:hypothetical protein